MKIVLLFSGGLDSLVCAKYLKEKGNKLTALYFKLPFISEREILLAQNFLKREKIKLKIFDCTKSRLLKQYIKIIKTPKYGRGSGINPCIDCKIFMLKLAEDYARKNKIDLISTGDVLDERPFSQNLRAFKLIDKNINKKIFRPLTEELMIQGRQRKNQIKLAEKYNIKYPEPSGGCILCEKQKSNSIKFLIDKNLINNETLKLIRLSRHFYINNCWFVAGKNENENMIIELFQNSIKSERGKPAIYFDKNSNKKTAEEIQKAYQEKNISAIETFKL